MLLIEKQWEQRRVAAQRPHFSLLTRRCSRLKIMQRKNFYAFYVVKRDIKRPPHLDNLDIAAARAALEAWFSTRRLAARPGDVC